MYLRGFLRCSPGLPHLVIGVIRMISGSSRRLVSASGATAATAKGGCCRLAVAKVAGGIVSRVTRGTLTKAPADQNDRAAERKARQAPARAEPAEIRWQHGEEREPLTEPLPDQGRRDEANTAFRTADRFEQEGASALADGIRARLRQMKSEASAGQDRDRRPRPSLAQKSRKLSGSRPAEYPRRRRIGV
jgi:hypothetical protein